MPQPKTASRYDLAYFEAQNFLIAATAIGREAQKHLLSKDERSVGLQFAKYVNHAYACELLLKCIMIIENGQYFSGHNLLNLFRQLHSSTQQKLIEMYRDCRPIRRNVTYWGIFDVPTIEEDLEDAQTAFVDFRYLFERKPTPNYDLNLTVQCLEHYILTVKPELKNPGGDKG